MALHNRKELHLIYDGKVTCWFCPECVYYNKTEDKLSHGDRIVCSTCKCTIILNSTLSSSIVYETYTVKEHND